MSTHPSGKAADLEENRYEDDEKRVFAMPQSAARTTDPNFAQRAFAFLVKHGVEERGIQPVAEEDRVPLTRWTYWKQAAIWAAANTNILTFSAGNLAQVLFALPFKASVGCIIGFNFLSCLPVAYLATMGPKLGMRQLVIARYSFGFYPTIIVSLLSGLSGAGFLITNAILGGQTLGVVSEGKLSNTLGVVLICVISLFSSFVGLKAIHRFAMGLFPLSVILFVIMAGISGKDLHLATAPNDLLSVSAGQVLGYGATLFGFTISWATLASDFTTYLPPNTPSRPVYVSTFLGLYLPTTLLQIYGTAISSSQFVAAGSESTPGLIAKIVGLGPGGKTLLVLFALSVTGNNAPSIYSCGLALQVMHPWLISVPRYFFSVLLIAICLPIAIVASDHFFETLSNLLYVLGYWIGLYLPPVIIERLVFRQPVSTESYPLDGWDGKALPFGYATVLAWIFGGVAAACSMAQTWWVGWLARLIPLSGYGDIAFELGFVVCGLVYLPARYLERKWTGR